MNKRISAFTLIELLVASAIFSAIILSIYSAFSAGLLSYVRIDSSLDEYRTARTIFSRVEADLKSAFPYLKTDSKFTGAKETFSFFSIGKGICRVVYNFKDGVLKRACYKGLDSLALESESEDEGEVLSGGIKNILFEYAYADILADGKAYEWKDSVPENKKGEFPVAVKIILSLGQETEAVEYRKVIRCPIIVVIKVP